MKALLSRLPAGLWVTSNCILKHIQIRRPAQKQGAWSNNVSCSLKKIIIYRPSIASAGISLTTWSCGVISPLAAGQISPSVSRFHQKIIKVKFIFSFFIYLFTTHAFPRLPSPPSAHMRGLPPADYGIYSTHLRHGALLNGLTSAGCLQKCQKT